MLSATHVPRSQQRQGAVAPDHQHAGFIWGVSTQPSVGDDTGHVGAGKLDGPLRALGAGHKLQTAAETRSALHVKRPPSKTLEHVHQPSHSPFPNLLRF